MKRFGLVCSIGAIVLVALIAIGIIIALFFAFTFGRLLNPNSPPRQAAVRMEENFQRDKEQLVLVRDFLFELRLEYKRDFIMVRRYEGGRRRFDGTVFLGERHGWVPIEDEAALDAIRQLFSNGYNVIIINDEHIRFQLWSTLDNGWGALYVFEGSTPYTGLHHDVTLREALSADGWYFYMS